MTTTITIDPPLPCCVLIAAQRRCGQDATVAQATRQIDGSYYLQPFCKTCVEGMQRVYAPKAPPGEVEVYVREECPFNYCDSPGICRTLMVCRHTAEGASKP